MPDSTKLVTQPLYGGAIELLLPKGYMDVSQIREIPDNQEVFVNDNDIQSTSSNSGNESIIVELMESVDVKDGEAALIEHCKEIVDINYSNKDLSKSFDESFEVLDVQVVAENRVICKVKQKNVGKWENNKEQVQELDLYIGLIRLTEFDADALITLNVPISALKSNDERSGTSKFTELLKQMVLSFDLKDKHLFG
ncbi:hypothetical protein ACO0QE_002321 [Hanseniaspora vineae]